MAAAPGAAPPAPRRFRVRLHPRLRLAGTLALGAYLVALVAIEISRSAGAGPHIGDLASTPSGVAAGRVWQLLTSGLLVAGVPALQLALMVPLVAVTMALLGPATFWAAALAGHIGSTLIAYAGVGALWLVDPSTVADVVVDPDYGVSCVWSAALGALLATPTAPRPLRRLGVAGGIMIVLFVPFASDLAGVEHVLAFALGALVATRASRAAPPVRRGNLSHPTGA